MTPDRDDSAKGTSSVRTAAARTGIERRAVPVREVSTPTLDPSCALGNAVTEIPALS